MKIPVRYSDILNSLGRRRNLTITDEFIFTSCPRCRVKQNLQEAKFATKKKATVYRCKKCGEPICRVITQEDGSFGLQSLSRDGVKVIIPPKPGKAEDN